MKRVAVRPILLFLCMAWCVLVAHTAGAWEYVENQNIVAVRFEPGDTISGTCASFASLGHLPRLDERQEKQYATAVTWCTAIALRQNSLSERDARRIPVGAVLLFPHVAPSEYRDHMQPVVAAPAEPAPQVVEALEARVEALSVEVARLAEEARRAPAIVVPPPSEPAVILDDTANAARDLELRASVDTLAESHEHMVRDAERLRTGLYIATLVLLGLLLASVLTSMRATRHARRALTAVAELQRELRDRLDVLVRTQPAAAVL